MSLPRIIPDDVADVQIEASDPEASAWVSANAGSGKTHVLAQRVIRLLLRGVDPAKILCITFTKAAAANMANRVFGTLAEWSTLADDALDDKIGLSAGTRPSPAHPRARATTVRLRAGDAGRAESADHPRLLHAAAASVSVRGQCRRALHRARRGDDHATARPIDARRAAESRRRAGKRARPGACHGHHGRRRPDLQGRDRRRHQETRRYRAMARPGRRCCRGDR